MDKRIERHLLPSISIVLFALLFMAALTSFAAFDVWWHLKTGDYILTEGLPDHDIFSYTAQGERWITHEWLSEILFFSLASLAGLNIIIVLKALLIATTLTIVFRIMFNNGVNTFLAMLITTIAAGASAIAWLERPHLFTLLFIALFLYILAAKLKPKQLLLLPLLMLLWVNLHAGFVFGLAILFIYLLSEALSLKIAKRGDQQHKQRKQRVKYLAISLALCVVAIFINPNTYEGAIYPLQYLGTDTIHHQFISEWKATVPIDFTAYTTMLLLIIFSLAFSKRKTKLSEILLLLMATYLSLTAVRNIAIFAIITAPILANHLQGAIESIKLKHIKKKFEPLVTFLNLANNVEKKHNPAVLALAFTIVLSILVSSGALTFELDDKRYPVGAANYLEENYLPGNMFNTYGWGGYLIWRLYPEYKVFVDGRADLYGGEIIGDFSALSNAKSGWEERVEKYKIDFFVVRRESKISSELNSSSEWENLYLDNTAAIYKKKE